MVTGTQVIGTRVPGYKISIRPSPTGCVFISVFGKLRVALHLGKNEDFFHCILQSLYNATRYKLPVALHLGKNEDFFHYILYLGKITQNWEK